VQSFRVVGGACVAVVITLAGCAIATRQKPTPLIEIGPNAYSMTKRSGFLGARLYELKMQVEEEALAVCKSKGQAMSVLDSKTDDPDPPAYPTATVQFRCVPVNP
jgi:hypothetical protein